MDKPVPAQIGHERALQSHGASDGFRDYAAKDGNELRHLLWIRCAHEPRISREFFQEIADRHLVGCGMQHPLAQHTEMIRKILRGGVHRRRTPLSRTAVSHASFQSAGLRLAAASAAGRMERTSKSSTTPCALRLMSWI